MNPLAPLQPCLAALARHCDVLPAVGGAVEAMAQPDADEREDELLSGEGVVDRFAERPAPRALRTYTPCPPLPRTEQHCYRWFLDGTVRSYFLCTLLEGDRATPVLLSQIGAALLHRRDNGRLEVHEARTKLLLLLDHGAVSDAVRNALASAAASGAVEVVDTEANTLFTPASTAEPRERAQGMAKYRMRQLEVELARTVPSDDEGWLILDGTTDMGFYYAVPEPLQRAIGVSKSFTKTPRFRAGSRRDTLNLTHLLAGLPEAHRTPAFVSSQGRTAFWYVRLRPQGVVDYPLMGVVKVDLPLPPEEQAIDAHLLTALSRTLVAERTVSPYGRDVRWHAHLYPIYSAEQAIKARFLASEMLREGLAAQWRRLLAEGR